MARARLWESQLGSRDFLHGHAALVVLHPSRGSGQALRALAKKNRRDGEVRFAPSCATRMARSFAEAT
jgi:hypothetical protein